MAAVWFDRSGTFFEVEEGSPAFLELAKAGAVRVPGPEGAVTTPSFPDGVPTTDWKVAELKAYAEAHGVELGDASTKAEIVAVVAPEPEGDDEDDAEETLGE